MYIVLYKTPIHKMHNVQNMCIVQYCTIKKIMILLQNGKDFQCKMCLVLLGDRFDSKLLGSFVRPKQLTNNHEPVSYFSDHLAKLNFFKFCVFSCSTISLETHRNTSIISGLLATEKKICCLPLILMPHINSK